MNTLSPERIGEWAARRSMGLCAARIQGMRLRASIEPPRAATGGFPYPARTCDEWEYTPTGELIEYGERAA